MPISGLVVTLNGCPARVDASLIEYQPVTRAVATNPEPVTATTTITTASSVGTDFQPRSLPGRVQEPVELEAVDINRDFRVLRTYQETRETEQGQLGLLEIAGESDFRNVYVQPFNHSPLLMRVETGMTFRIEQVLDNWYRISTERGAGYVRSRDVDLDRQPADSSVGLEGAAVQVGSRTGGGSRSVDSPAGRE